MRCILWSVFSGIVLASLLGVENPAGAGGAGKKPTIVAGEVKATAFKDGVAIKGTVLLKYDAGPKHPYVEVWVSVDGADLKKVFEDDGDGKGARTVTIGPGKKYRFVLTDFGKELDSVTVRLDTLKPVTPVAEDVGAKIVAFAAARVNQKGVGDGECTRLIEQALAEAGARRSKSVLWSKENGLKPGDIMLFKNAVFESRTGAKWNLGRPDHQAIVEKASGLKVTLLHQNVDGDPAMEKSRVRRLELDLAWIKSGGFIFYRPVPK